MTHRRDAATLTRATVFFALGSPERTPFITVRSSIYVCVACARVCVWGQRDVLLGGMCADEAELGWNPAIRNNDLSLKLVPLIEIRQDGAARKRKV